MTNDLYVLDLETCVWKKLTPVPDQSNAANGGAGVPRARYFHSANQHRQSIIFFGGMGYTNAVNSPASPDSASGGTTGGDGLCVLDDVVMYDVERDRWFIPSLSNLPQATMPRPRYAHLSSITAGRLAIIGGQDMSNNYITEINVLDMHDWTWVSSRPFDKHCGAYRSVAVSSAAHTNLPLFGPSGGSSSIFGTDSVISNAPSNSISSPTIPQSPAVDNGSSPSSPLVNRSRSPVLSTDATTSPINQRTNSVASDAKSPINQRTGSVASSMLTPNSPSPASSPIRTRTTSGTGSYASQSRRQPSFTSSTGSNSYYRLSYTTTVTDENPNPIYLYSNYNFTDVKRELQVISPPTTQSYQIVDHSTSMTGAILPPGLRFPTGAILGHHLIISGTYLTNTSQTFSIWAFNLANYVWTRIDTGSCFSLGSWNRGILCESLNKYVVLGNRDRSLVEDYNHRQTNFDHVTIVDLEAFGVYQPPPITMSPLAQELGLALLDDTNLADFTIETADGDHIPINSHILSSRWPYFKELVAKTVVQVDHEAEGQHQANGMQPTPLPLLRTLYLSETTPVVIALVQFLYTDNLLTSNQHQPHVLSHLLVLAELYRLPTRLADLASHALHQMLNMSTAALIYETAALTKRTGLQIRALKVMIAAKKMMSQKEKEKEKQQQQVDGASPTVVTNGQAGGGS